VDKTLFSSRKRIPELITIMENCGRYEKNIEYLADIDSTFKVGLESGITVIKNNCSTYYLSHEYAPMVKAGITVSDLLTIIKYENVMYESKYGKLILSSKLRYAVTEIMYKLNRMTIGVEELSESQVRLLLETFEMLFFAPLNRSIVTWRHNEITLRHSGHGDTTYVTLLSCEEMATVVELVNEMFESKSKSNNN